MFLLTVISTAVHRLGYCLHVFSPLSTTPSFFSEVFTQKHLGLCIVWKFLSTSVFRSLVFLLAIVDLLSHFIVLRYHPSHQNKAVRGLLCTY